MLPLSAWLISKWKQSFIHLPKPTAYKELAPHRSGWGQSSGKLAGEHEDPGWISLGWKDPLEEMTTSSSVFLQAKFRGQKGLAGYSQWGPKELDTTEQAYTQSKPTRPLSQPLKTVCYVHVLFQRDVR